jgi:hypothetical protein
MLCPHQGKPCIDQLMVPIMAVTVKKFNMYHHREVDLLLLSRVLEVVLKQIPEFPIQPLVAYFCWYSLVCTYQH